MRKTLAVIARIVFAAGLLASAGMAQQYLFNEGTFSVKSLLTDLAVVDVNGDGINDVVVGGPGVTVMLGRANGGFEAPRNFSASRYFRGVAGADFNSDGRADIAAVDSDSQLWVFLGNAVGNLVVATAGADCGPGSVRVTAGDFNNDSKADVAVSNSPNWVAILLGDGDGTFGPKRLFATAEASMGGPLLAQDFNNDGNLDVAAASAGVPSGGGLSQVSILLGNGNGTLQPHVDYGAGRGIGALAAGDLNGDGHLDLALSSLTLDTWILYGIGDGTFVPPVAASAVDPGRGIAVGDLDADGDLDIVTGGNHKVVVRKNGPGGPLSQLAPRRYGTGMIPQTIALANINGDNVPDIVTVNIYDGTVSVLLNNGDATFGNTSDVGRHNAITALIAGDFNGDNQTDVVATGPDPNGGGVTLLISNNDGTFRPQVVYATANGSSSVLGMDLNKDGIPDLTVTNQYNNTISILFGLGAGTFLSHVDFAVGQDPTGVAAGDFDGDRNLDLAVVNSGDSTFSILQGNGFGLFAPQKVYPSGLNPRGVVARDFNKDTRMDLAITNTVDNNVSVHLGRGDGTFQRPLITATLENAGQVLSADLNADGNDDLVVVNGYPDPLAATQRGTGISVLLGNGDGTFGGRTDFSDLAGATSATIADLDGDGKLDIAVSSSGGLAVLVGNGEGAFRRSAFLSTDNEAAAIAAGDFDGDGKNDLVTGIRPNLIQLFRNPPAIALRPNVVDFGRTNIGSRVSRAILIFNPGVAPLRLSGVSMASGSTAEFTAAAHCPETIGSGEMCTVTVTFLPRHLGTLSAIMQVSDNALGGVQFVYLTGTVTSDPPSVTLLAPRTGERVFTQGTYRIQWAAANIPAQTQFDVLYSVDAGVTFAPVAGCTGLNAEARSCAWTNAGPATSKARLRIIARDNTSSISDASDGNFNIVSGSPFIRIAAPTTAVNWGIGSAHEVRWSHNLGGASTVTVEISRDGGQSWSPISGVLPNVGLFNWTATGPATSQARLRVNWANGVASDTSDISFTIAPPFVAIGSPNTPTIKWGIGTQQYVTWSTNLSGAEELTIRLSLDGGTTFPVVLAAAAPNERVAYIQVPNTPTTQAKVKIEWVGHATVSDVSAAGFTIAAPSITLVRPNGGEVWGAGTTQPIGWTSNLGGGENVRIDLSTDAGATWRAVASSAPAAGAPGGATQVVLVPSTPSDGNLLIPVPEVSSATCRVRIMWLANPEVADVSDADFSIGPAALRLTSPAGGEVWTAGASQKITWASNLGGYVTLKLSTDRGATWSTLIAKAPNSGSATVVVPHMATGQARLWIESLTPGFTKVADTSKADFTILAGAK